MSSPKLGPRNLVYEDRYQQIYRLSADFGTFQKEYYVRECGQRAGLVVVQGDSVLLVRQYRLLIDDLSWEIPGGKVDEGETPESGAIRECAEETGLICRSLKPLVIFHPGLDTSHNPTHIFYTDQFKGALKVDYDPREVVETAWVPLERCIEMVFAGQVMDSLSMLALLSYRTRLGMDCS